MSDAGHRVVIVIPGADLAGVQVLRSAADAEVLKRSLGPGKRLAVVGGGYIGLEAAASGQALGAEAVVLEVQERILARASCEALSTFFTAYHKAHGVSFELNAAIERFEGEGGKVIGVRLADGRLIACDIVLLGVGIIPNDELAKASGLECANGVVVDEHARPADQHV